MLKTLLRPIRSLSAPQPTRPERLASDSSDTKVVVKAPVTISGSAPAKISVTMFLPAPVWRRKTHRHVPRGKQGSARVPRIAYAEKLVVHIAVHRNLAEREGRKKYLEEEKIKSFTPTKDVFVSFFAL
jgi:hypothetical protein